MTFVVNNNQQTILSGTWDSSSTIFSRLGVNVEDLNSHIDSTLLSLSSNGAAKFQVYKGGTIKTTIGNNSMQLTPTLLILTDTVLVRDAANIFAQRYGTAAQTFRIYNSYTNATTYERASLGWNASAFTIQTETESQLPRNLVLGTSGTPRLFISSTGQIGIGTQTPTQALHVSGNAIITSSLSVSAGLTVSGALTVYQRATGETVYAYKNPSGNNLYYALMDTSNFHHYYSVRPYHNLNGNGYVFDGNNNPNSSVSIGGQASLVLNPSLDGAYEGIKYGTGTYATIANPTPLATLLTSKTWAWNGSNGYSLYTVMGMRMRQLTQNNNDARFSIYTWPVGAGNPTEIFNILSKNGNVGIGVINPLTTLHVLGTSVPVLRLQTSGNTSNSGWEFNVGTPGSYDGWFMLTRVGQSVPGDLAFDTAGRARFADTIVIKGSAITSDATHILAQRSDANSQKFRIYNTYVGSNFEALEIGHTLYSGRQYQYVSAITSGTGAANIGMAIVPASGGSFSLAVPNGLPTGGNQRGLYSIDLQIDRSSEGQVATGDNCVVIGSRNTANATRSMAIGFGNFANGQNALVMGYVCTGTGLYSIATGHSCMATGTYSIAMGKSTSATDQASVSIGDSNNVGGNSSLGIGFGNTTSQTQAYAIGIQNNITHRGVALGYTNNNKADYSVALGRSANTYVYGQQAHSAGVWSDGSIAQRSIILLRNSTTSSVSAVQLYADNNSASAVMKIGTTWMADVRILARETNGPGIAMYHRRFLSQRVSNTSEIIGSIQTIGTDYESDSAWDVAISVPDATDHLQIDVSGSPTSTVKWLAEVSLLEIGGYA